MTITQIKWFLAVARTLNFTKAADQLGVSQPTLSRQIVNMEEELNLQLFIRSGRSISLTPAARSLVNTLGSVYDNYLESVSEAQQIQRGISGDLRIRPIYSRAGHETNYDDMVLLISGMAPVLYVDQNGKLV